MTRPPSGAWFFRCALQVNAGHQIADDDDVDAVLAVAVEQWAVITRLAENLTGRSPT